MAVKKNEYKWFIYSIYLHISARTEQMYTQGSSFHSEVTVKYQVQHYNSHCLLLTGCASEEMSHQCESAPAETRKS